MINEIFIKDFGPFRNFSIKDLAQVNMIVGDNGVGKTELLNYIQHENECNLYVPFIHFCSGGDVTGLGSYGGIVVVDNLLNGVHHSRIRDAVRTVVNHVSSSGLQIFMTTHRWECIVAFHEALQEFGDIGKLIRLEYKNGELTTVHYSAEDLAIAVEQNIEVR